MLKSPGLLGLDAEWADALLQLASRSRGPVAKWAFTNLNSEGEARLSLAELLLREDFLKVGVGIAQDSGSLSVDLQPLAVRHEEGDGGLGLGALCWAMLRKKLDKRIELRRSDWTGPLNDEQVQYAACDAFVAVEIMEDSGQQAVVKKVRDQSGEGVSAVNEAVVHAPKRQTLLYGGIKLLSPKGLHLANVSHAKAAWYVKMGLAHNVEGASSEVLSTVKLNFEPKGVGHAGDAFYLQVMENQCVGCGAKDHLVRFSIVPHVFRALLPRRFKEHSSHDIVLLCHSCYIPASTASQNRRQRLLADAGQRDASAPGAKGRFRVDECKLRARGAAAALRHALPNEVREEKEAILRDFLGKLPGAALTKEEVEQVRVLDVKEAVEGYVSPEVACAKHLRITEACTEDAESSEARCFQFVLDWRQTFLDSVKPQYLPAGWDLHRSIRKHDDLLRSDKSAQLQRRFGRWQEQPVAEVLTLDSDLALLEEASLSVTLREALSGKNLSIRAAFDIFDTDKNGSLDMVETWAALYHLGLRGISADQVVRFFDLMDEAKVGRVGFREFHNFVQAAVEERTQHHPLLSRAHSPSTPETATLPPHAPLILRRVLSAETPSASPVPLFRQTSPVSPSVPEGNVLTIPLQPPDLARLSSGVPGPSLQRGGTVSATPPQLGRVTSFQATSLLFAEPRFKEELELAKKAFAERVRSTEEAHAQRYTEEIRAIEEKQDAEEERTLGPNPTLSEAGTGAEWSFQRSRLPHGAFTTPPQRFDFEIDPDSLVPGRKRCILQAGCSLSVPLPVGLASLGGLRPALEACSCCPDRCGIRLGLFALGLSA
ncbi:EXD2 [Symbiodinium sp. KB8]|nr:EXD2 [Symbiodinium sp. KB8]